MSERRRMRIISVDGVGHNTKVAWADTDEPIPSVREIHIHMTNTGIVYADLQIAMPSFSVEAIPRLKKATIANIRKWAEALKDIECAP